MFQACNINNRRGLPDDQKVLFLSYRSQGGNVLVVYKAAHDPPGLCADSPGTLRAPRDCASGAAGCVRSGAAIQRGGSRSSGQS